MPTTGSTSPPVGIDASVITEPLDSLLAALELKLERQWPERYAHVHGAQQLFVLTLRTANVTYRSIRFLAAEKPPDPTRKLEYSISISPLNRTILDNLFSIVFILEDVPARCEWYLKSDWRETRLELERCRAEYGQLSDWQEWLDKLAAYSDVGATLLGLSPAEIAKPSALPTWPSPGNMANHGVSPKLPLASSRAFLRYLNDWFYADLSQQSHLGGSGLIKRAGGLIKDYRKHPEMEQQLIRYRKAQIGQTITLMLSLASELEAHFAFGLTERVRYLWTVLTPFVAVGKEVFDKRYAGGFFDLDTRATTS